jgi:hypothetical protein
VRWAQVRIVDKHVRKGKLYLKKAVVLDVHPGSTADVSVEESQEVLQVGLVLAAGPESCRASDAWAPRGRRGRARAWVSSCGPAPDAAAPDLSPPPHPL